MIMRKLFYILLFIPLLLSAQFAGGSGTSGDPYQIATALQLDSVRNHLSSHYILTANIDLSEYSDWIPIGDNSNPLTGNLDGNYKTISNLTIITASKSTCGLIGICQDNIKNLTIKNANINIASFSYYIFCFGVLSGASFTGLIQNVKISHPIIRISGNGYANLAAFIGTSNSTDIRRCSVDSLDMICNSSSANTGSIVGGQWGGGASGARDITETYATGDITVSQNNMTAGFIGYKNVSSIINCYSRVNIHVINQFSYTGLAGFVNNFSADSCKNSYSAGILQTLTAGGHKSGFIDYNIGYAANTNYFDSTTAGTSVDNFQGGSGGSANAKSTTQMKTQATFSGWDFVNIWKIDPNVNNGYPYLRNNPPNIPALVSKRLRIRR